MDEYAQSLSTAVDSALPRWVERSVRTRLAQANVAVDDGMAQQIDMAVAAALSDVMPRLVALLSADVDAQSTTPLEILRSAVVHPTAVLQRAGVLPALRDDYVARRFPDDIYDLSPANYADIDQSLADPALAWGASKAMAHMKRHGSENK